MNEAPIVNEAPMTHAEHGLRPAGPGWFVLNLADCAWKRNERFGTFTDFQVLIQKLGPPGFAVRCRWIGFRRDAPWLLAKAFEEGAETPAPGE